MTSCGIRDHKPWDRISSFLRDQGSSCLPFLWDQGPKFVTLLESRIRNFGTEMVSAMIPLLTKISNR